MRFTSSWALLSLAAILALGGCGSDNDDNGAQTSSVSSAAAQSSEAAVSSAVSSTSPDTGDSSSAISSMDSSVVSSASAAVSSVVVSSEAVNSEADSSAALSSVSIFPGDGSSSSATAQSSSAAAADTVDPDEVVIANDVPYVCEDTTANLPFPSGTELIVKSGTEGDVLYDCQFMSETQGFQLKSGIASLTAVQIIRDDTFYGIIDGQTRQGHTHYDYSGATIRYTGSAEDLGTLDCTETYKPQTPVILLADDTDAMYDIFYWDGIDKTDPDFVSTTCPDWFYEDEGGDTTSAQVFNYQYTSNYVITDDQGGAHKISIYGSMHN